MKYGAGWAVAVATAITTSTGATEFHVYSMAAPSGNGSSWPLAFQTLQQALTAARNDQSTPHLVRVAEGTYRPHEGLAPQPFCNSEAARETTFALVRRTRIVGGFHPTLAPEIPDPTTFVTILSGDICGDDEPFPEGSTRDDNSFCVVTGFVGTTSEDPDATNELDRDAVLRGFTIIGGNAEDPDPDLNNQRAGGILIGTGAAEMIEASPIIRDCIVRENLGAYANQPSLGGEDETISGAGIAVVSLGPVLKEDPTFVHSEPVLRNLLIEDNLSGAGGAGLWSLSSSPLVLTSTVRDNDAAGEGGGLSFVSGGSPRIENGFVFGNTAGSAAGGIGFQGSAAPGDSKVLSDAVVVNTVVAQNSAGTAGGGISLLGAEIDFINCTIADNNAATDGAGCAWSGSIPSACRPSTARP